MKKLIISACILLINEPTWATKFTFQKSPQLPTVEVKVTTENIDPAKKNRRTETRKIYAANTQPVEIDVLGGDGITELTIKQECGGSKVYCEEIDEIYIAYPKPDELKSSEENKSERGTYIEKIKRYNEPKLREKTRFKIEEGWGLVGFFNVRALD